ncbi:hypothetical protein MUG91_G269n1, partial [Manis pentadactyla]
CHDSSGSGHSAFKPEVANGVPAAFVPEPGPLQRGLSSQSSDGELRKRTCTSAVSCSKGTCTCGIRMSSRNAITSSYTSTGGISQPPAPWISGSITVEEYYQEKQAQSQWLKRIFEDKTVSASPQQRLGGPPPAQPQTLPRSLSLALV